MEDRGAASLILAPMGAAPPGAFGEAGGKTLLHGRHQRRPRKRISPLAQRMGIGDEVRDLQADRRPLTSAADSEPDPSHSLLLFR